MHSTLAGALWHESSVTWCLADTNANRYSKISCNTTSSEALALRSQASCPSRDSISSASPADVRIDSVRNARIAPRSNASFSPWWSAWGGHSRRSTHLFPKAHTQQTRKWQQEGNVSTMLRDDSTLHACRCRTDSGGICREARSRLNQATVSTEHRETRG